MKRQRQQAILDLVLAEPLGSQEAILERLGELGFRATQSTISRDLEELGLTRVRDGEGRLRYAPPGEAAPAGSLARLRGLMEEFALRVEPTGNLVVIRTPPGAANALAQGLDATGLEEVAGTIAGDDTILVVAREGVRGRRVVRRLEELMGGSR